MGKLTKNHGEWICEDNRVKQTKHKTKKPSQKPDKKKLDDQCLDLLSDVVIARDHVCRNCQSDFRLSNHHIRVRSHKSTRYDPDNCLCLCWKCHSLQKFRPESFQDMIIDVIRQKEYDRLRVKSNMITSHTIEDLLEIKEHLKSILKEG